MYRPYFQPQPIGFVPVAVPGTPVQLVSLLVGSVGPSPEKQVILDAATDAVDVNKIVLSANPANTGNVYIGTKNMNKVTGVGVLAVLLPTGGVPYANNVGMNIYHFQQWYVDADVAGEGAYGTIDQV